MKRCIVIIFILLMGCQLIVDVDVPREASKAVINSVFTPDSVFNIVLTRSNYILDPDGRFFSIPDADVSVFDSNGNDIPLTSISDGFFRGTEKPIPGEKYRVTASAPGFESVEAETTIPSVVPMIEIAWDSAHADIEEFPGTTRIEIPVRITFSDAGDVQNYYTFQIKTYNTVEREVEPGVFKTLHYANNALINIEEPGLEVSDDPYYPRFSDKIFDGKTFTLNVNAHIFANPGTYEIIVLLGHMNKDYFQYMETYTLNQNASGDPFAQPVQVFSNIQNGLGILGGLTTDKRSYKVN